MTRGKPLGILRRCFYSLVCTWSMHRQLNMAVTQYKTSCPTFSKAIHSPLRAEFRRKPSNATSLAQGHFVAFRPARCGNMSFMLSLFTTVPRFQWRMGSVKIKFRCLSCGSTPENGTLLLSCQDVRATM